MAVFEMEERKEGLYAGHSTCSDYHESLRKLRPRVAGPLLPGAHCYSVTNDETNGKGVHSSSAVC